MSVDRQSESTVEIVRDIGETIIGALKEKVRTSIPDVDRWNVGALSNTSTTKPDGLITSLERATDEALSLSDVDRFLSDIDRRHMDALRQSGAAIHDLWNWDPKTGSLTETQETISTALEKYVFTQAHLFWMYRGLSHDGNKERERADYYDAKRYIGYLLAEKTIRYCLENKECGAKPADCYLQLHEEYIDYLNSISIEEFIRTQAYFRWGTENSWNPVDDERRRQKYYYDAQKTVECAMWNCRCLNASQKVTSIPDCVRRRLLAIDDTQIDQIVKAKRFAHSRLSINRPEKDVEEYTRTLYENLKKIVTGRRVRSEDVESLLDWMYQCSDLPNMFEYLLRCLMCSCVDPGVHNKIRATWSRPPLS